MAVRFLFSDEAKHLSCAECTKEERDVRGCIADWLVTEEENEETGFHIYQADTLGTDRTPFIYDDIACYCCPRCCIKSDTYEIITTFSMCKQLGQLPYGLVDGSGGALYDQPAALIEAFMIITSEIGKQEQERHEELKRQAKIKTASNKGR